MNVKTNIKTLLLTAALVAVVPLAACQTTNNAPQRPVDLSFSQMQPLQLNVGNVRVVDQTANPNTRYFDGRVAPAATLSRYAKTRLQAVGGEGTLNFVIQQASLTSAEAEGTGDWTDSFRLSNPMEYTITMRVGLELAGRTSQPNVRSAYTLERKKTLPAGSSLADRDRELNLLLQDMIGAMDTAIERGIDDNMRIIVRPGPITFGKPAEAMPDANSGMQIVPPSTADGKPVVIQGTMN
ncbi:MAG: hypothetical protein KGQ41_05285 [Alphaproteobacteria bacterium]|nr:hypothetical protein [Alphaproteobacteria bacterium]